MSNPGPNILAERTDRHKLPIGIQTFREIRAENYYYVDKTAYIRRMDVEDENVRIVTTYRPSELEWLSDLKTRRRSS